MRIPVVLLVCLSFLLTWIVGAQAQTVTVLSFDHEEGLEDSAEALYLQMRAQIDFSDRYILNDVPEQYLDDLVMAVGCIELDAECSDILRDTLGSQRLVWGQIARTPDGGMLVSLYLWDLMTARLERERFHSVPEGPAALPGMAALLMRSLLHGDDASTLTITSPVSAAVVFADGELLGGVPQTLGPMPSGRVLIRLEAPGMQPREAWVSVDIGEQSVEWTMEPGSPPRARAPREASTTTTAASFPAGVDEPAPAGRGRGLRVASLVGLGAGTAMLAAGIASGVSGNSTQQQFDDLVALPVFDVTEARSLQNRGENQLRTANALVVSGGVMLAAGAVGLLLDQMAGRADTQTSALRIRPSAGPRHVGATMQLRF
jgi:hypothetical protein